MTATANLTATDWWARLREPFKPEQIGKLPRRTIDADRYKALPKSKCSICGGWHPSQSTIHLDFVGHADVTDRLLEVDPHWDWEPLASDAIGSPHMERSGTGQPIGLWIKLTVKGVTRIGFGSCEVGKRDAEKELIGDAIRNAAMRFGVALDLWRKEHPDEAADASEPQVAERAAPADNEPEIEGLFDELKADHDSERWAVVKRFGWTKAQGGVSAWLRKLPADKQTAAVAAFRALTVDDASPPVGATSQAQEATVLPPSRVQTLNQLNAMPRAEREQLQRDLGWDGKQTQSEWAAALDDDRLTALWDAVKLARGIVDEGDMPS